MTTPELISFIKKQKDIGVPEANYQAVLFSQGWKLQDINEALSILSSSNQTNNSLQNNNKNYGLLIAIEIIFMLLLAIGFITGNKSGLSTSLSDLVSFLGIILIIPGFIMALIGIKDSIVSMRARISKGIFILLLSLLLLTISIASGIHLYQVFHALM
jgi:hypothetical protein